MGFSFGAPDGGVVPSVYVALKLQKSSQLLHLDEKQREFWYFLHKRCTLATCGGRVADY
jgi:hypothetical protein